MHKIRHARIFLLPGITDQCALQHAAAIERLCFRVSVSAPFFKVWGRIGLAMLFSTRPVLANLYLAQR
jgi:hypothetical protein